MVTAFNKTVGRDELARIKVVDKKGVRPACYTEPRYRGLQHKVKVFILLTSTGIDVFIADHLEPIRPCICTRFRMQ